MDGTLFTCVIALAALTVAKKMYEFRTVSPDRRVKYERVLDEIKVRQLPTEWDRKMDTVVRSKYKELYYAAYVDDGKDGQQIRQVVMEYIKQYHPEIHDEVESQLELLKRTAVKGPADWRKIVTSANMPVTDPYQSIKTEKTTKTHKTSNPDMITKAEKLSSVHKLPTVKELQGKVRKEVDQIIQERQRVLGPINWANDIF